MLFVPGDRADRFGKAVAAGADAVILDLEDAVLAERRPLAREAVAGFLARADRPMPLWVRINPVATADALQDLVAVIGARPDGIVLPKARSGDDLERLDHWLEALELRSGLVPGSTPMLPLITECATAVLNAASFAACPPRVIGFTWGAEDLSADVGALRNRDEQGRLEFTYELARSTCLLVAAAAEVAAIDTVDTEIRDPVVVERNARLSRCHGFAGKLAIHPAQVPAIHAAFAPSAAEIDSARRVIDAFAAAAGQGAVSLDGRMLDRPHLRQAEQTLELAGRPDRR
ncbi:MAG TPA: CoA ester lyase [Steroidobacteraceae bacterium]|nr:CoA ester lyase [Steroidobacteraceae bacterium]